MLWTILAFSSIARPTPAAPVVRLRGLSAAPAAVVIFGPLAIEPLMGGYVFALGGQFQVFYSVVCFDFVNVVNDFRRLQRSAEVLFHNIAVLKDSLLVNSDHHVSVVIDGAALPVMMISAGRPNDLCAPRAHLRASGYGGALTSRRAITKGFQSIERDVSAFAALLTLENLSGASIRTRSKRPAFFGFKFWGGKFGNSHDLNLRERLGLWLGSFTVQPVFEPLSL